MFFSRDIFLCGSLHPIPPVYTAFHMKGYLFVLCLPINWIMLPPHHPESVFSQVTNDLHAIKFEEFFQSLSSLTSQWHLMLLIASSLLRYFLPLASFFLFFSYLSENASLVSFGSSFSSNWLLNVGVPKICIIFSPYTLPLGNFIHNYGMYPIFISLVR